METGENLKSTPLASRSSGKLWDILSVLLIIATVLVALVTVAIFANPFSGLNPFPPPQMAAALVLPSATPTAKTLPPTWTPTPSQTPMPSATISPATATATVFSIPGSPTPTVPTLTPTATVKVTYAFALRGTITALASSAIRGDSGCEWMGVGGQVFDLKGAPMVGYTIQLGGMLGGTTTDLLSLTGTALQYGTAGYEFSLANHPIASNKSLWIQLLDQAGLPLSEKVYFNTSEDCQKNLTLVNFKQVR